MLKLLNIPPSVVGEKLMVFAVVKSVTGTSPA